MQMPESDYKEILDLLSEFYEKTGSVIAKTLMDTWPGPAKKFIKVNETKFVLIF